MSGRRLLGLLTGLAILLNSCGERPQPIPLRTIPLTDVNPYGVNVFLDREVEDWKMRRELQMIKDAGIGYVKQEVPWFEIEPVQKGQYVDTKFNKPSWDKYDKIINLINEFGLRAIIKLDQAPNWTRKDNRLPQTPPDNFNDYGDFVFNVVSHLKDKGIHYYQIWNEPNIQVGWGTQSPSPAVYTQMLKIAFQRAKQADPNAVILSAPLAITLENNAQNVSDLAFIQGMYDAGAKSYFDVMGANAYGLGLPPSDPPDPNKLNFQRVTLLRAAMERNGDAAKPIWFDEFGWNASPADMSPDKLTWNRVTEQQQAEYTRDAIKMARAWGWVGVINIWYFRQDGTRNSPADSEYYFRMVNPDFSATQLYAEIQSETPGIQLAQPGSYEETNPGLLTSDDGKIGNNWQFRLDPKASGGTLYASNKLNATIIITFRGTSIHLKTLTGSDGGMVTATIDGSPTQANKLPRNPDGKAYIDLFSPQPAYQQDMPVADGLSFDKHVLQLIVSPNKNPASQGTYAYIDGFTVGN